MEVDVCSTCHGVWLDRGELERLALTPPAPASNAMIDDVRPQDRSPEDNDHDDDDRRERSSSKSKSKSKPKSKKEKKKPKSLGARVVDALDDVFDDIFD